MCQLIESLQLFMEMKYVNYVNVMTLCVLLCIADRYNKQQDQYYHSLVVLEYFDQKILTFKVSQS